MEQSFKLKTKDKHTIYGTRNYLKGNTKAIIFVHGLTGNQDEHTFYNAARFFPNEGFDTIRFDLYCGEKNGRILTSTTLQNHAEDIETVLNIWKKKYRKLFLVGHSLGGPSIILTKNEYADAITLWDPSLGLEKIKELIFKKVPELKCYKTPWGTENLISNELVQQSFEADKYITTGLHKPTKIIFAGKGVLYKRWKPLLKKIKNIQEFSIIKNAGHNFNEEGTEEELFKETLQWFNKF